MCAIIDANVAAEVFGDDRPEAGEEFFEWIDRGKGVLVVGGRLYPELVRASAGFRAWAPAALLRGKLMREDAHEVNAKENKINSEQHLGSDDPHVLALAEVSGARLLYTNDRDLQQDFRDHKIINEPRGNIYTTLVNKDFVRSHKDLLSRRNLCSA